VVLPDEALHEGPGLDQRAVHREVPGGHQPLHLRQRHESGEELLRHRAIHQPLAIAGEGGRVPHGIVDGKAREPAEEQVMVDLSMSCRSERIEQSACRSVARSSISGGIEGRPIRA
jgi:hypothetical protein